LILAPTRELALQVARTVHEYGNGYGIRVLAIYGGTPYGRQKSRLRNGVDVVVGTPGRILDLIKQKALRLEAVQTVVLDEADEMLSMGFIEDIEAILDATPEQRQTALFSATMPAEIRRLADRYLNNPQSVTIKTKQLTVAATEQRYYLLDQKAKLAALTRLFEMEDVNNALVFTRTRIGSAELANALSVRGFQAEALNGDLSQDAREQVMRRFRENQVEVLVATDVAARGLDIDDISHVFNYDIPLDPEAYVHRIGRTGRAGKTGIAISFITLAERRRLQRIEGYTRQKISLATLPTVEDIQTHREGKLRQRLDVWLKRGRCNLEKAMVQEMVEGGHDLLEIAAAALKLARAEDKQRPIEHIRELKPGMGSRSQQNSRFNRSSRNDRGRVGNGYGHNRSGHNGHGRGNRVVTGRSHEDGMVRLVLNAGKIHGVRPNDVVGVLANKANIPGYTIGAIHIQQQHTLVDVPEQFVPQVLASSGSYQIHRQSITVERAS